MPPVSKKQKKFMDAAAHNPAFAKKVGVPMSVAKDYSESGKGKKFAVGGAVAPRLTTGKAPVQMASASRSPTPSAATRSTVAGAPVQMASASRSPTPPPAARTTTTAPQAMAKSFGPKYFKKGGTTATRSSKGKSK